MTGSLDFPNLWAHNFQGIHDLTLLTFFLVTILLYHPHHIILLDNNATFLNKINRSPIYTL